MTPLFLQFHSPTLTKQLTLLLEAQGFQVHGENGAEAALILLTDHLPPQPLPKELQHIFLLHPHHDTEIEMRQETPVTWIKTPVRFKTLLEKLQQAGQRKWIYPPFCYIPQSRTLNHEDQEQSVLFTEKEGQIFAYLLQHMDQWRPKSTLMEGIWGYANDAETHTLETHLYQIRKKIEKFPEIELANSKHDGYRINIKN